MNGDWLLAAMVGFIAVVLLGAILLGGRRSRAAAWTRIEELTRRVEELGKTPPPVDEPTPVPRSMWGPIDKDPRKGDRP